MSRPKSPERLQLERDRAIRRERRERRRQECEAKRKERFRKKLTHESVVKNNGISPVGSGGIQLGIHDAIAYSELVQCGECNDIVRKIALIGDLCPKCKFGKEVVDSPECLKIQGDEPKGGRVGPPMARKGEAHEPTNTA